MDSQHTWDFRVLQHDGFYAVHEVYYTDGIPDTCSVDPIAITGEDLGDLRGELNLMAEAFNKPVLPYSNFVNTTIGDTHEEVTEITEEDRAEGNANNAAFRAHPNGG
jgi:hypothetical protein